MASPRALARKRQKDRRALKAARFEITKTRAFKQHLLTDLTVLWSGEKPQRWINKYFPWVPMGLVIKGS